MRGLNEARYFVFRDLIIPTGYKNLPLTQIDHVVVSHYGIFCIETKSNQGSIYGYTKSKNWKQYLGADNIYTINNPYSQNRGHVHALNALLKGTLRAPIHDYVTFPNAKKVTIDGCVEDLSLNGIVEKIAHHTQPVYNDASVERIAKMLAHAAAYRNVLRDRHIEEVRAYLEVKVARTLRY